MAKRQHKIKIFLSIVKIPCFCQKNSKNPEKLIVFQGFYSGQHFYPLNMAQRKGFEPLDTFLHHTISNSSNLLIEMIEHVLFFHADLSHVKPAQNHVLYRKAKVCGDIDRLQK